MLTFEEITHTYRWNGSVIPSVTQVLAPLTSYQHIAPDVLARAQEKGKAVHKLVELHANGDLDVETLPDWMRPVLVQWERFVADTGFKMLLSEHRVYHPQFCYAGTLDLYGSMNDEEAHIDVKRSFLAGPVIGYQLAGYQAALYASKKVGKKARRYALKLNENGHYRLEPFADNADFNHFVTCLAFHRLKEKME